MGLSGNAHLIALHSRKKGGKWSAILHNLRIRIIVIEKENCAYLYRGSALSIKQIPRNLNTG